MARNAKQILRKAIQDIEDGRWKQKVLIQDGEGVPEDLIPPKCDVYMGCALGLVAMHGGHGTEITQGQWEGYFNVDYPDESAPPGVRAATQALYSALPKGYKNADLEGLEIYELTNTIVDYNDRKTTTKARAAAWFKKALELA